MWAAAVPQTVDQRTADQRAAQAAVDDAKARIRDGQFDLEHCYIAAPFSGRIGSHLVSVGNLIAGSRAAASPTTSRSFQLAWSKLVAEQGRIASIGTRCWTTISQGP
jgi:multidrug resistance efflux pump